VFITYVITFIFPLSVKYRACQESCDNLLLSYKYFIREYSFVYLQWSVEMTDEAVDIRIDSVVGRNANALPAKGLAKVDKLITLNEILKGYGELGLESQQHLTEINQRRVELKRNQRLYSLAQGREEVFVVKKGWVALSHSLSKRSQDICNVYMPGDLVGVRESFFNNYDVSIWALENCELDRVSVVDVHSLFERFSDIKRVIVSYIMVNDNIAIERLRSCTHHKAEERVAHFLLEIFARYRFKKMIDSNCFSYPITQEVVGELLGITSVHVSRCMTALEQKKMIRKTRSTIKLLQPELMAENTGFDEELIYGHLKVF